MADTCNVREKLDVEMADVAFYGGGVKALGGGKVAGYLVLFSGDQDPDLVGDFFTKDTYFGTNMTPPVLYHHGMDSRLKARVIGKSELTVDDAGVWIEAQLDMRDEYERLLYERLVESGKAGWSSGASTYEREPSGKAAWLKTWIIGEASITPTPAEPRNQVAPVKSLGEPPPIVEPQEDGEEGRVTLSIPSGSKGTWTVSNTADPSFEFVKSEEPEMDEKKVETPAEATPEPEAKGVTKEEIRDMFAEFAKAFTRQEDEPVQKSVKAPTVLDSTDHWKFDKLSLGEAAFLHETLKSAGKKPSDALAKSIAMRLESTESKSGDFDDARRGLKSTLGRAGVKANEIMQSTLASYGDEWIGVAYSSDLWEQVRLGTFVPGILPNIEFPAGAESMVIPIESTDPVFYKVAQSASLSANPGGIPTNTVTSSQLTTGQVTMSLAKLGARVLYTGELNEDAMIPFVAQLQRQIAKAGAEYLESAVIDGDTATGASTNINDIAGTPAATDWFMTVNGFRKSPLVTTTANSRDGGVFGIEDFIETVKLMGGAGINGLDRQQVVFIMGPNEHYAALQFPEVKTRDVFSGATLEGGMLTGIWGYPVLVSGQICKASAVRLSNTAGKVDVDTVGNNTKGSLLAVRKDQWLFGYRRRMQLETTRVPAADATEIVALLRFGLTQRDTEASAITYNLTV